MWMGLQLPDSMDELIYWTSRVIGSGTVKVWVRKQKCSKCKKADMSKPIEKGKVKIRAKEYVCPNCHYAVEKKEYEESLIAEAIYTCPSCGKSGEYTGLFKRKSIKGVQTFSFPCSYCMVPIDVTKKMKEKKKSDAP